MLYAQRLSIRDAVGLQNFSHSLKFPFLAVQYADTGRISWAKQGKYRIFSQNFNCNFRFLFAFNSIIQVFFVYTPAMVTDYIDYYNNRRIKARLNAYGGRER